MKDALGTPAHIFEISSFQRHTYLLLHDFFYKQQLISIRAQVA